MISERIENQNPEAWYQRARLAALALMALIAGFAVNAPFADDAAAQEVRKLFAAHTQNSTKKIDHSAWSKLLKTHVHRDKDGLNRFDYAGLRAGGLGTLKKYLNHLQKVDPAKLSRDEQFAYWVNLYNAKTVEIVADHYPVKSIRKIRLSGLLVTGPWKKKTMTVSGVPLSLDDVEHGILRPIWRDPRIHYAVNCASVGCPNLARKAYTGSALKGMLDEAAQTFINSPRGARFNGQKIVISKLYEWYGKDFGNNTPQILAHIRKYARPALADKISSLKSKPSFAYDWTLNDKK